MKLRYYLKLSKIPVVAALSLILKAHILMCVAWTLPTLAAVAPGPLSLPARPALEKRSASEAEKTGPVQTDQKPEGSTSALPEAEPAPDEARRTLRSVCPHIYVDLEETSFKLDEMEKRLACGDSKDDKIGRPWSRIPPGQAAFFIRSFLQSRARHQPRFSYAEDDLFVRAGTESKLKSFEIRGVPDGAHLPRKREIKSHLLDPSLLNALEGWALGEIKHQGYPCGRSPGEADPQLGAVRLNVNSGERKRVLSVVDTHDTGLKPFILDRYDAFTVGQWYDQRLIELTRRRTMEEGIVESITFNPQCTAEEGTALPIGGVVVERDAVLGPSRQASVGVGASTEKGPRIRAQLRFLRLDDRASQSQMKVDLSFRQQTASASARWRYSERFTRSFVEPSVTFDHDDEPSFDTQTTTAHIAHGWTFEFPSGSATATIGPSWQEAFVTRGPGPGRDTYFLADAEVSWQSHDYEYFKTSPRSGSQADIKALATEKSWGANFTAEKITASGEWLWNVVDYDPPLFILAARYRVGTTFVSGDSSPSILPVRFRYYAGGIDDSRGFDRQSLPPNGQQGALTEALGSLEGRFYRAIFHRADPFLFLDVGKLGPQNASLDPATYWSPGAGVRYESPIGVFRVYGAQGIVDQPNRGQAALERQWRFNLTYGEEF